MLKQMNGMENFTIYICATNQRRNMFDLPTWKRNENTADWVELSWEEITSHHVWMKMTEYGRYEMKCMYSTHVM